MNRIVLAALAFACAIAPAYAVEIATNPAETAFVLRYGNLIVAFANSATASSQRSSASCQPKTYRAARNG